MSAVAVADVVDTDEDTEEDAAESKTLAGPSSAEALADADDALLVSEIAEVGSQSSNTVAVDAPVVRAYCHGGIGAGFSVH